ncbi:MAG TPA: 50S ribosomal protein L27 [Candidatus Saccharimonadales bacterium]|nr:50S ribosomal protein L27 [Candidatus Saccharimonadales bacterium]
MAHKKAGGSKARQGGNVAGKRLGFKIYGGEKVKNGQVILRQRGTAFHEGDGVGRGRDHTLFAKIDGKVNMKVRSGKRIVEIQPIA